MTTPAPAAVERDSAHCAHTARACCEDPIGSVFLPETSVLVELPLPWAHAPWSSPHVAPELRHAVEQLKSWQARAYAIAPDDGYAVPGMRRVIVLTRPAGLFASFERAEYLVPAPQLPELLAALPAGGPLGAAYRVDAGQPPPRDLLICTHGSHDACCGRLGYPIYHALRTAHPDAQHTRVWRVSHFGGHRFAPTMLEFPSGLGWAYLDERSLEPILRRSGPIHAVMPHLRGWGGLRGYYLQLAERAIMLREGWAWLDYARAGTVVQGAAGGYPIYENEGDVRATVHISYRSPDGSRSGTYEATIERFGQQVTALSCAGRGLEAIHQYRVDDLRLL